MQKTRRLAAAAALAHFLVNFLAMAQLGGADFERPVIRGVSPCGDVGDNGGLPLGFSRVRVTPHLNQPLAMAFGPDGRVFFVERTGSVRLFADGALQPEPVVTIPEVGLEGEQGLHGIAVDPQFDSNGFLYIRYTTGEPRNRLSRFRVIGGSADPTSETILWEAAIPAEIWHQGGTVEIGPDGKIYTSVGDHLDAPSAQSPASCNGKILRLNLDGSAPADNPLFGNAAYDPRIWAMGLRNPFRFCIDAPTGDLWIGDVGSYGPTAREEINLGRPGLNFGWPNQEGDSCYIGDCNGYTPPVFGYPRTPEYSADQQSAAIVMGPRYRGGRYPAGFEGSIFFADYTSNWIRRLVLRADGTVDHDEPFADMLTAGAVVDLKVGPDGWLYSVVLWSFDNVLPAGIYRYEYDENFDHPPVALATASTQLGEPPLVVQFDGSGSSDPDNDPLALAYCWDFGDGSTSDEISPTHTYADAGAFEARLTIRSGKTGDISPPISIRVGHPPVCDVVTPKDGTTYRAGDTVHFSGAAFDVEEGWLASAALTWEVFLVHATHVHPFVGPLVGVREGQFSIPSTGHSPEDTHYQVRLTATDSDGLTSTADLALVPETAHLTVETDPPGIAITLDEAPTPTPRSFASLVGFEHQIAAVDEVNVKGTPYRFIGWSNEQPRAHVFTMPESDLRLVAVYAALDLSEPGPTDSSTSSDRGAVCPLLGAAMIVIGLSGLLRRNAAGA